MNNVFGYIFVLLVGIGFCSNTQLPNIYQLGCGYNSLGGQPVIEALRLPITELTYSMNKTIFIAGTGYTIPDQVYVISDPTTDSESTAELYTSVESVEQSLLGSLTAGFSLPLHIPGMFSISTQATFFTSKSTQSASYTAFTNLRVKSWKAVMLSATPSLSPNFLQTLSTLPTTFNSTSCPSFKQFINLYGTHCLYQVLFGGSVSMTSSFSISHYSSSTAESIELDLNTQFFLLTFGGTLSSSQQQQLSSLNAIYSSSINLVGGNPSFYQPSEWTQWANTVPSNPIPVSMDMRLIADIVPSSYQLKTALTDAIEAYLASQQPVDYWSPAPVFPENCFSSSAATIDDQVYVVGGECGNAVNYLFKLDSHSNTWQREANVPVNIYSATASALNDTLYLVGGYTCSIGSTSCNTVSAKMYAYNVHFNTWTSLPSMPTARSNLNSAIVGNILYVIGGYSGIISSGSYVYLSTVEAYNIYTGQWSTKTSMPVPRGNFGLAVVGEKIYVYGGYKGCGLPNIYSSTIVYDTTTNLWSTVASMPISVVGNSGASVDGIIYSIGGSTNCQDIINTVLAYDPQSNTWSYKSPVPVGTNYPATTVNGNQIYIIGGSNLNDVQVYTAAAAKPWC